MKKGPWFWNFEGCWVLKRALTDEDGNPAGYELLDGDYDALAPERAERKDDHAPHRGHLFNPEMAGKE